MLNNNILRNKVKEYLKINKLSIRKLSIICHTNRTDLGSWINHKKDLSNKVLNTICNAIGLPTPKENIISNKSDSNSVVSSLMIHELSAWIKDNKYTVSKLSTLSKVKLNTMKNILSGKSITISEITRDRIFKSTGLKSFSQDNAPMIIHDKLEIISDSKIGLSDKDGHKDSLLKKPPETISIKPVSEEQDQNNKHKIQKKDKNCVAPNQNLANEIAQTVIEKILTITNSANDPYSLVSCNPLLRLKIDIQIFGLVEILKRINALYKNKTLSKDMRDLYRSHLAFPLMQLFDEAHELMDPLPDSTNPNNISFDNFQTYDLEKKTQPHWAKLFSKEVK